MSNRVVGRMAAPWHLDARVAAFINRDDVGQVVAFAISSLQKLKAMEGRLDQIGGDTGHAGVELITDQDASRRAGVGRPPGDAIRRIDGEIGEDLVGQDVELRCADVERSPQGALSWIVVGGVRLL